MNPPVPQMPEPQVDVKLTTPLECEKCKGQTFTEALMFRKVSALLTKNGKAGLLPIQVFACVQCGNIPVEFIPKELKDALVTPSKIVT